MDVDAEMDHIATRRDGSVVYTGDVPAGDAKAKPGEKAPAKPEPKPRPAPARREANTAPRQTRREPDPSTMSRAELAQHYKTKMLPRMQQERDAALRAR